MCSSLIVSDVYSFLFCHYAVCNCFIFQNFAQYQFCSKFFLFVAKWLRHYAASRKVAGSSPDEVDFLN
jgi:hypothetical protein